MARPLEFGICSLWQSSNNTLKNTNFLGAFRPLNSQREFLFDNGSGHA